MKMKKKKMMMMMMMMMMMKMMMTTATAMLEKMKNTLNKFSLSRVIILTTSLHVSVLGSIRVFHAP
jgi:hypothetical protein